MGLNARPAEKVQLLLARLEHVREVTVTAEDRRRGVVAKWTARCPGHADRNPSLSIALTEDGRVLLHCFAGCDANRVLTSVGLSWRDLAPGESSGDGVASKPPPVLLRQTDFEIRDAGGRLIAVHRRMDFSDGTKRLSWLTPGPDGKLQPGLGGLSPADLPLFGVNRLDRSKPAVVVVEGEKAADALLALGVNAVGTVTGASSTPSDEALRSLLDFERIYLWADKDAPGRQHMLRIGDRLRRLGAPDVRVLEWADAPDHGDAADFVERYGDRARAELQKLVAVAQPFDTWARDVQAERARVETEAEPEKRAVVVCLADVEPEPVRWLWRGRLALGKLTLLEGDPGTGKSVLYAELAAIISRGRPFPDQAKTPVEPGSVVIVTCEDGLGDTIRKRIDAAGADPRRIFVLREVMGADGPRAPMLPQDAALIEQAVHDTGACLLIVDPLSAHVDASVNMYRDQDVRRVLTILAGIAERCDCAVLAVRHLNKATGLDPIYRGGGSIGIVGQARFAFLLANHPEQPEDAGVRVLAPVKANIGRPAPSLVFRIESWDKDPDTARIRWEGTTTLKARDLLRPPRETKQDEAAEWLREQLADGPRPAREIFEAAEAAGFSERTIRRAQRALGVVAERVNTGGSRGAGAWYWRFPHDVQDVQDCQLSKVGNLERSDDKKPQNSPVLGDFTRVQDCQQHADHLERGNLEHHLNGDLEALRRRVLELAEQQGFPAVTVEGLRLEPSQRAWKSAVRVWTERALRQALALLQSGLK
ncbi:AAA family ATPase [Rhodothermus marinus]|uniref:AAA family ATPase n=1 Tax=Rhodothermus marinus TaxID=29549 RepID=UPI0037CC16FE